MWLYWDLQIKIPEIKIEKKCANRVLSGHLWIFENEITSIDGNYTNGDIVRIFTQQGRFVGKGYINSHSKIAVRILSFQDTEINSEFFARRIEDALKYRLSLGYDINGSFRVIFSEGDMLPGLIVDKYEDKLSIQILTLGMDKWKDEIVKTLTELFNPVTIIERSDVDVRKKEGLEPFKGILYGKDEVKTVVTINGLKFEIDMMDGHKTGFYLDQQENRHSIEPYVKGGRVLDCFAYSGAFALYAVKYGAKEVLSLEDSGKVMEMLRKNILLNEYENMIKAEKGDAFQWLRDRYKAGERFDCIMLDPPSFVKDKGARGGAARGYKDINLTALKLLNDGGFLITSSCSQNVSPDHFLDIIHDASVDAGCLLQLMENRPQSKDHPILLSMPQTHYLKFVVVRKIERH